MAQPMYHNSSFNGSNDLTSTQQKCSLKNGDIVLVTGYMLVFVIGTIGNSVVLKFYKKNLKNRPNIEVLISYLAFFNLVSSILDPLIFGYWILTCNQWHFGPIACKALPPLCRVSTNISIGIILIMAIDRCRMIVSPLTGHLKRFTLHACVLATVILGFATEINYVYGLHIKNGSCKVRNIREYHGYSYPLVIVVTSRVLAIIIILACTTTAASFKLKTTKRNKLLSESNPAANRRLICRYQKVTRMLVVMATVFSITVLPRDLFHLVYTLSWITPGDGIKGSLPLLYTNQALKLLQTSNAIYNVFIYAGMYQPFRKMIKSVLVFQRSLLTRVTWRKRSLNIKHASFQDNNRKKASIGDTVMTTTCVEEI